MSELVHWLNTAGGAFVAWAGPMLLQFSVLIVLLAALDLVLLKRVEAVTRYGIWLLGVVESKRAWAARIWHIVSLPFRPNARRGLLGLTALGVAALVLLPMARGTEMENLRAALGGPPRLPCTKQPTANLNAWVSLQVLEQQVVVLDTLKPFSDYWPKERHKVVGAFSER
jgi:hypothetical protein